MKIQTRTMLILSSTIGFLILSVIGFQYVSLQQKSNYIEKHEKIQKLLIKHTMQFTSEHIIAMNENNSAWDDLVHFCNNPPDLNWVHNNIDLLVRQYKLDYIWIYNKKFKQQYFVSDTLKHIPPVSPEFVELETIFRNSKSCHYYKIIDNEIIEIVGSNVIPASDNEFRRTPSQGYLLVGKFVNKHYLSTLANATGFRVCIAAEWRPVIFNERNEQIFFTQSLCDFKGQKIATIYFIGTNELKADRDYFFYLTVGIAIIFSIIFLFLLYRSVTFPIA